MTQPTHPPVEQEHKPAAQSPAQAAPAPEETAKTAPLIKTLEPDAEPASQPVHIEVRPHAFVIMPFGKKKGADGAIYEFNAIYSQLIKPALELAGFEPFRADEETASGDILTDMFRNCYWPTCASPT